LATFEALGDRVAGSDYALNLNIAIHGGGISGNLAAIRFAR
jgi:ribosomal protein S9